MCFPTVFPNQAFCRNYILSCQLSYAFIMTVLGKIRDLLEFFSPIGHDPGSLVIPGKGEHLRGPLEVKT